MRVTGIVAIVAGAALAGGSPFAHAAGCSAGGAGTAGTARGHFIYFSEQPVAGEASVQVASAAPAVSAPAPTADEVEPIVRSTLAVANQTIASLPGLELRLDAGRVEIAGDEVRVEIGIEAGGASSTCEARQGAGCAVFLKRYVTLPLRGVVAAANGRALAVDLAGRVSRLLVDDVSRELERRGFAGMDRLRQRAARLARLDESAFAAVI